MGRAEQRAVLRQPADASMTEAKLPVKRPARHPSSPLPLRCRKTCPMGREELEDCRTPLRCVRQTSSPFHKFAIAHRLAPFEYFKAVSVTRPSLRETSAPTLLISLQPGKTVAVLRWRYGDHRLAVRLSHCLGCCRILRPRPPGDGILRSLRLLRIARCPRRPTSGWRRSSCCSA